MKKLKKELKHSCIKVHFCFQNMLSELAQRLINNLKCTNGACNKTCNYFSNRTRLNNPMLLKEKYSLYRFC